MSKSRKHRKNDRNAGRKRPADAEVLLGEVVNQFSKIKKKLGARKAAEELGVGLASFYNYVNGDTLPDMAVLRRANDLWGFKSKYIDFSAILPKQNVNSPKQLVFSFLQLLRAEDIEVIHVGPKAQNVLQVTLKIRFSA